MRHGMTSTGQLFDEAYQNHEPGRQLFFYCTMKLLNFVPRPEANQQKNIRSPIELDRVGV